MALPRAMRFRDRRELRRLLRVGRRFRTPLGTAIAVPSPRGCGRVLFVISKAVAKKSTVRHRIKRQLDAWAAEYAKELLSGRDIVVFISPAAAASTDTLRRSAGATIDYLRFGPPRSR
ncbi:MAG: ribonuclease P protein component [Candidatus Sungbacteria bacterium]|uniref:Ribonuclease P protein component n=1 Tax=Candidatus Sungiibacteriota bacterium TaxID=2750080 RepID=A0A932YWU3_9BACT|nr:ribonuclease P protein component [Candidatus Sungbacteria bacterium]